MDQHIHVHLHMADVLSGISARLETIEGKVNQLMATQAEWQAKLDQINANTTASAAAAQVVATKLQELRDAVAASGLTGTEEANILGKIDEILPTTSALKTFLESTASGPVTQPEPEPVPTPVE
jgi:anti-sigma factor ChrR (cupin superfamily)